ncbi:MAG: DinB family protein [Ferruginibacter sp.]
MKVYSSLIDRLKTQHEAIKNILSTIDNSRLLIRTQPDKWNIHDNIAHLTRYQPVFINRINQILLKEEAIFGRYIADQDPEFEICRTLNTVTLIQQLSVDRKSIYDLIVALTDTQINRIGIHKKYGRLNIIQWTEFFLLHESHHIFTIFQLAYDTELS